MILSRKFWVGLGVGGVFLTGIVVIFVLRNRSIEPTDVLLSTPSRVSRPMPPSPGLTKEEQAIKDEIARLEKTLPKDISETWSPELRKLMEERTARRGAAPTSATTATTQ